MKHYAFSPRIILIGAALICAPTLVGQDNPDDASTQFLFPKFTAGTVRMKNGSVQQAEMNYNTLAERMIFRQNGRLMEMTELDRIDTVILQNCRFVPFEKVFYEVLFNGPVSLFVQNRTDLKSVGRPSAYGTTSQTIGPTSVSKLYMENNTFEMKVPEGYKIVPSPFYWIRQEGDMYKFMTERQFLKIFPGREKEIQKFIDQQKLDMKEKEDLKILVKYCNELNN
jgi:hypothetical protein